MSPQLRTDCMPRQRHLFLKRAKNITTAVVLAAAMAMLTSLKPVSPYRVPSPLQGPSPSITMNPPLFPAFDPTITDYIIPATAGAPVQVTINAPVNTQVSVDGQPFQGGAFTASVSVSAGQSFPITTKQNGVTGTTTYYTRCVPPDFPPYTVEHNGPTQAEWYVIVPDTFAGGRSNYVAVFDPNGVPVWWYNDPAAPLFGTFLNDGHLAWTNGGNEAVVHGFDGKLLHTINPIGGYLDIHELLRLHNGNYVFIAGVGRGPVDLSAYGGSKTANILDNVIEEVDPSGTLVWRWSAMDHISPAETAPNWRFLLTNGTADAYHMNAVESDLTGAGYLVSCRHMDSVFYVDKATGNIKWKLGGTPTPHSLKFVGDTYGNFGGQHDVRMIPASCAEGPGPLHFPIMKVSLLDDGTGQNRPPRGVRYLVNTITRTATLLETVTDPEVPVDICCGSARPLPKGNWVMSWGGTNDVAEYTHQGQRVFHLKFAGSYFSYRAVPILPGSLDRAALRDGMDAQFPR